ncbi:type II secretion system F family protein [Spirillospora sp. NBC_01491]|uniref:type II secretion system F family protein n=1 Tax=Spirillospora sp. NBC_01491 TaxID=2976007 RepID=UPI002E322DE3|nr:type II secretion system F family protein [Spirillospora sp. NBC_01491]
MIDAIGLAALCCSGAVWLLLTPSPAVRRLDRMFAPPRHRRLGQRAVDLLAARVRVVRDRRKLPGLWRTAVIEICDGMAAELAAGRTPDEAFAAAAAVLDPRIVSPLNEFLTATDRSPSPDRVPEIPDRLAGLAGRPGAEGLRLLAACWRIGAERGGTLATVLDSLAAALRDQETQRQEVAVQLAGPRSTARFLAILPALGLAMAAALGANPITFLFGTLPGAACLTAGIGLDLTGLWWTRRLAQAAATPR